MKIPFSQIRRDYLALRGESPDLLPLLEEGEDSAVLTIADELRVRILQLATEAELALPYLDHDEIRSADAAPERVSDAEVRIRMPDDYLMLYSLKMPGWLEPLTAVEPPGSLRGALGAAAPAWMTCPHRPMALEGRDTQGVFLRVLGLGSGITPEHLLYVARPTFDGNYLTISSKAYPLILK